MPIEIAKGVSFPFRFGAKGRVLITKADEYDDTHIKESIKQILLTNIGERPMEPEFGSDVRKLVFQENHPALDDIAIDFAIKALGRWETRIEVIDITILREYGMVYMTVNYKRLYQQAVTTLVVNLGGVDVG